MVEHVLPVTRAVTQPAEQPHDLRMDAVQPGLEHRALALGFDGGLHLAAGLFHHFLDARRMDAPVGNQPFQRDTGDFPPHRIETGERDGLRGVVDDQIHARQGLDGADVPPFPADDAALHLVVGQRHHRNGGFRHLVRSYPLDGVGDEGAGPHVRFVLELGLNLRDLDRLVMHQLVRQVAEHILLRLLLGEAGNALEHFKLALFEVFDVLETGLDVLLLLPDGFLFFLVVFNLAVQGFFLLLHAALLPLHIAAPILQLPFRFGTQPVDFVLRLQQGLFLFGIRLQLRILADPLRFGLRRTDGHLGLFFSVSDPRLESDQPGDYAADDQPRHAQQDRDNQLYLHTEFMHLLRFLISIL